MSDERTERDAARRFSAVGWFTRARRRRFATIVAGWSLLGVGTALIFLPGPGFPLLLGGLALLGREEPWARRLRSRIESWVRRRFRANDPVLRRSR